MPNFTIRSKLALILGALTAAILATCLSVILIGNGQRATLTTAKAATARLADNLIPLMTAVRDMQVDVIQVQQFLTDAAATHHDDSFDDAESYKKKYYLHEAQVKRVLAGLRTPESEARVDRMVAALQETSKRFGPYDETGVKMARVYIKDGVEAGNKIMDAFDPMSDDLFRKLDLLVAETHTFILEKARDNESAVLEAGAQADRLAWIVSILGALGIIVIATAYWTVRSSVTRPLDRLALAVTRLAANDLTTEIADGDRADEIGQMARAVGIFKSNAIRLVSTEAETVRQRQIAERERAVNDNARAEIRHQQEAVVASIAAGLDRLSRGDLTSRLQQTFAAEYEKLRADFNTTADSLMRAMEKMSGATAAIRGGSDKIASASDDLSRRTEQQAANLEETAAAIDTITKAAQSMATNAMQVADAVVSTRQATESSDTVVQHAIEAMGAIEASSQQIEQIIGVIDQIAFQTNLLALNAGVEAARAGDAGRGFAVVASEVRALAQRSADAAKQIKTLIAASGEHVASGVELVGKTGEAVKGIATKMETIDRLVREISSVSHEQATSIGEINTVIRQMDQVVQQNAAMVEESTAAAHALRSETEGLATLMSHFALGDHGTAKPPSTNPVHAAQARIAQAVKQTPERRTYRPEPKHARTTYGSTASGSTTESWEEF